MVGEYFNSIILHFTDKSLDLYFAKKIFHFLINKRHSNEQSKE